MNWPSYPFPHQLPDVGLSRWSSGFAILAGMWPFHTWAPTGHVAAPTAASMLLAGVVMKLGAYGCLRVAMTLFPHGLDPWGFSLLGLGSWRDGLRAARGHRHRLRRGGRAGAERLQVCHRLLQRQPHGLHPAGPDDADADRPRRRGAADVLARHLAGLLFATVGRMVYERTHTRDLGAA
jgi:NADH-quinone oxidoreductase subunit M